MNYTIYKVTNLINGKYYIGKHQTRDLNDGYMGSGKLIKAAIRKYGLENFKKEILFVFETEAEMNAKEAELVVICDESYNLCEGGKGGFGYINKNASPEQKRKAARVANSNGASIKGKEKQKWLRENDPEWAENCSNSISKSLKGNQNRLGKTHSEETKQKISDSNKVLGSGNRNSQYGSMWITNGTENKKIKALDNVPEGWYKGRKIK